MEKKIVIIRIKGRVRLKKVIADTFAMLNLHKKNHCVIVDANPSYLGMVNKVKDYATWGYANDETLSLLNKRKKEGFKSFALSPPRKGYERKGTKVHFNAGGALGNRKDKINDLIKRMV
jgi:large subunit ribosomal protein L30